MFVWVCVWMTNKAFSSGEELPNYDNDEAVDLASSTPNRELQGL